ncbi:hypothetical protein GIB67_039465 [Kingdonia uniflora]|uniref:RNase H type-1 domain-containing protein n=1 Tax=Kingdonia uniflora TaxID=39325 RepID=A0A7J7LIJ8_9MAGN|nr:hypothetical protein GIB67_039465 [Kingdonia uniflora]
MRVIFWNIRGIGNKYSRLSLRRLVNKSKPSFIFIAEPQIKPSASNILKLGLSDFSFSIISNDCDSRLGNLWCLWKFGFNALVLVAASSQHLTISYDGLLLLTIYGLASISERRALWTDMESIANLNLPWLAIRDFNCIRSWDERSGGTGTLPCSITDFNDCIDACSLTESFSSGPKYSWCNNQKGRARILRRLDRALYNNAWISKFDGWSSKNLPRDISDHSALVGSTQCIPKPSNIPFRFLIGWVTVSSFRDLVINSWSESLLGDPLYVLMKKLQRLKAAIKTWKKENLGGLRSQIDTCVADLADIQIQLDDNYSDNLMKEATTIQISLNNLLTLEDSIWRQKSKASWLLRTQKSLITEISLDNGMILSSQTEIKEHIVECNLENMQHLFWNCPRSTKIWDWIASLFQLQAGFTNLKTTLESCKHLSSYLNDIWKAAVLNIVYLIWIARNAFVFEGFSHSINDIKRRSLVAIKDAAGLSCNSMANNYLELSIIATLGVPIKARPLPRIQTIGATGKAGAGAAARNHLGDVLGVLTKGLGNTTLFFSECEAILGAIDWAVQNNWKKIWIESDSQTAISDFTKNHVPWPQRARWNRMKTSFEQIQFSHCWIVANFSAYQAAKRRVSLPVGNLETFLGRPHFLTKIEEPNVCYFRFT